ncbi:hypothetical protein IMSAGC019_03854 [Lachnospiraceae bacterium]|nr:hypothetical protein IMSAGC019_03854 [Lachnospiraceae bacterium]
MNNYQNLKIKKENLRRQHKLTEDEIKKLHDVELELLVEFDRICRKYDIPYSIDGGTLLGAVRHKGFIPWDDDADVIMNREAYRKLMRVLDDELDKEKFYFQDMRRTRGYRWGYGKLRRKNTRFVRINQEHMPYPQGVFLDVFVCDNVPDLYFFRCVCNFQSFIFRKLFYAEVGKINEVGFKRLLYRILSRVPERTLKKQYFRYVRFRNRAYTDWVKCLTFPACNKTFGYKRSWYEDTIDMCFENVVLKASREYEEYLTFLYGDYMKLPPENERKIHPVSVLFLP